MPAPEPHLLERRRRWRLPAVVGLWVFVVVVASLWLTYDSLPGAVRSIGGRYREESTASGVQAVLKLIYREPVRDYQSIDLEHSRADDAWLAAHRDQIARQSNVTL